MFGEVRPKSQDEKIRYDGHEQGIHDECVREEFALALAYLKFPHLDTGDFFLSSLNDFNEEAESKDSRINNTMIVK
jgi:hypothetical protein